MPEVSSFAGIATSGLVAGLLFGWLVSVLPGLAKVSDRAYVTTMQSINREIINPWFLIAFVGTPFVLALAAVAHFAAGEARRGWWLTAAAATYVIGVVGVTAGGNIPLNDELDAFVLDDASESDLAVRRSTYERSWNRFHTVRTLASVVAFALATVPALTDAD